MSSGPGSRVPNPVDVISPQAHESISGGRTLMPLSGMAAYRCTLIAAVRHGGIPLHGHAALRAATLARSCRTEGGYARPDLPLPAHPCLVAGASGLLTRLSPPCRCLTDRGGA